MFGRGESLTFLGLNNFSFESFWYLFLSSRRSQEATKFEMVRFSINHLQYRLRFKRGCWLTWKSNHPFPTVSGLTSLTGFKGAAISLEDLYNALAIWASSITFPARESHKADKFVYSRRLTCTPSGLYSRNQGMQYRNPGWNMADLYSEFVALSFLQRF